MRMTRRENSLSRLLVALGLAVLASFGSARRVRSDEIRRADVEGSEAALARRAWAAHNRIREEADLPPLTRNPRLDAAARAHAQDMAARREMTHEGADGSVAAERIDRQGYPFRNAGENVARGQRSVEQVMDGWMNSPGHRKNILGKYSEIGLAVVHDDEGTPYWCVNFATPWPRTNPRDAPQAVLAALNRERLRHDLPPLRIDPRLNHLASRRAESLVRQKPTEDTPGRREAFEEDLRSVGYRYKAMTELAAGGQPDPRAFVKSIVAQPAQRETILGPYQDAGVGIATGEHGTPYWSLILGSPLD
ncbi:MAG: CAP domain-containing protein [Isosphaeraceae bacterium]